MANKQGFVPILPNPVRMENELNPGAGQPAPPAQFTAVPRKPRLIWQGKERRPKTAEPVPTQTVEIIRPFYANPNQEALNLGVRRLLLPGDKCSQQRQAIDLPHGV